jgi:hypothetical protein
MSAGVSTLGLATLGSWLLSVGSGGYMLGTWLTRGGMARYRATREGLPPGVIFTHFGLAVTGLTAWACYLATGWLALAWTASGALMPVTGLGVSTVTLWVPYPTGPVATGMLSPPAEDVLTGRVSDAVLTRALSDEELARRLVEEVVASMPAGPSHPGQRQRRPWSNIATLLPVGHGAAAISTILLTVVTTVVAVSTARAA